MRNRSDDPLTTRGRSTMELYLALWHIWGLKVLKHQFMLSTNKTNQPPVPPPPTFSLPPIVLFYFLNSKPLMTVPHSPPPPPPPPKVIPTRLTSKKKCRNRSRKTKHKNKNYKIVCDGYRRLIFRVVLSGET